MRIERGPTQFQKATEDGGKGFVVFVLDLDSLHQSLRQIGNALLKVVNRMFKGGDIGSGIVEEGVKHA